MTLSQKLLRLAIVLVPLLVFSASLFFDAFSYQYIQVETPKSYLLLLMGGTAFIGGGLLETMVWLANPIALFAMIRFLMENRITAKIDPILNKPFPELRRTSGWFSVLAAGIALSFSLWDEVLAAESGSMGKILALHAGYWLWTLSSSLLAIGVTFYNFRYKRDDQ
jgi:hypothetical protein